MLSSSQACRFSSPKPLLHELGAGVEFMFGGVVYKRVTCLTPRPSTLPSSGGSQDLALGGPGLLNLCR